MFNREKTESKRVPMMPVRDLVIFPQMMNPFIVGRESSLRALEEALATDKKIFLATQHDASVDDPKPDEIYSVGTLANIVQSVRLPDGNLRVLVEGVERAKAVQISTDEGFFRATLKVIPNKAEPSPQIEQAVTKVTGLFEQYVKLSQSLNYDTMIAATRVDDPAKLSDTIASNLQIPVEEKQELLENFDPLDRLTRVGEILESEIEKLNVDRNINTRVKRQMERAQKEYYLNEKLKAIHKELGRGEKNELEELKKKIETSGMPKDALEKATQELKRLEMMPPMSAESTVSRNYLDWLLAVPWKKRSKEIRDIALAEKILEEEHYGLEKIKERILEFLAVRQLVKNPRGSILCFVGPPGVGKTSLAMSIGRATGRKFIRVSLGGVRDEAEIRGHRRTYIGALPGQIIQMMKKAGTVNPIFVLDEVDKMSTDFRGDPSAALMEVLDPELNNAFTDHYLDVEYDLSKVMFVCTANVLHTIPQPLQDRMEILRLPGYTEAEKAQIAKRFLVRKARESAGLTETNVTFTDEAISHIIRHYTHEAGVRSLEREISSICRKVARRVVKEGKQYSINVARGRRRISGCYQVPGSLGRKEERSRPHHGSGVDRSRRFGALHRSHDHAGQGPPDAHRQAGRRHAGIGPGGHELRAVPYLNLWPASRFLPPPRHPHARSRRRDSERRPLGWHHDRHFDRERPHAHPGALRRGHDRRNHPARQGPADRRHEGKVAGGSPRRNPHGDSAEGQRKRFGGHPGGNTGRTDPPLRREHGPSSGNRLGTAPDTRNARRSPGSGGKV